MNEAIPTRMTMRMTPKAVAESRSMFDLLRRAGGSTSLAAVVYTDIDVEV
jgi:hypothetical protein